MPFVALITPPAGPLDALEEAGLDADGVLAALLPALVLALAGKAAPAPSSTSTWPAATDELAVAVTLNSEAILLALEAVPVP